jgi:acetyltransferase-like isoleucine patch superfamily enzyme
MRRRQPKSPCIRCDDPIPRPPSASEFTAGASGARRRHVRLRSLGIPDDGIVRAGASVSHDVRVGEFAFVGPNATILGRWVLGDGAHLGPNAVCRERTTVGAYAVVGIGAVVVREVTLAAVVAGNPARPR